MDIDTEAWIISTSHQFAWWLVQEAEMQEQGMPLWFVEAEIAAGNNDYELGLKRWRQMSAQALIGRMCAEPIVIQYEEGDPIIHTDALPYCWDEKCPCHGCSSWAQVEEMIDNLGKHFDAGLLTAAEQDRLWQGRQV